MTSKTPKEASPGIIRAKKLWLEPFDLDKTYYLSGPMAGYPHNNFPAFEVASKQLRDAGLKILSPHEVAGPEGSDQNEENTTWAAYLRRDLIPMLHLAGGIILIKGWPQSRGARLELHVALSLEMPVWYYERYTLHNMNGSV